MLSPENFTASQVSSEVISYCSVRQLYSKIATVQGAYETRNSVDILGDTAPFDFKTV